LSQAEKLELINDLNENYQEMDGLRQDFIVNKNIYGKVTVKLSPYDQLFVRAISDYVKTVLNLQSPKLNAVTKSFVSSVKNNDFKTLLRLDISAFQSNVNGLEILDLYIKDFVSEFAYNQLKEILIDFNQCGIVGIPRGVAVSNLLAEVLLQKVDAHIKTLSVKKYLRYADDIFIVTDNPQSTFNDVIDILKQYGLQANDSKRFIGNDNEAKALTYLGYSIKYDEGLSISIDEFHFQKIVAKIKRRIRRENNLQSMINRVNGVIATESKFSILRHYKYVTDFRQLKMLDSHIYRQIRINYFGRNKDIDRRRLPIKDLRRLGLKSCVTEVGNFKKSMYNFAKVVKQ
jgi:hypothetical protein